MKFPGYDSYKDHHENELDNDSEKKCTTAIKGGNDFKWLCKHYPDFEHLKNIKENKTGTTLKVVNILCQSLLPKQWWEVFFILMEYRFEK